MELNMVCYTIAIAVACLLTSKPLLLASDPLPEALPRPHASVGRQCVSPTRRINLFAPYSASSENAAQPCQGRLGGSCWTLPKIEV
ncbi:hypothetical protein GE21DRAFT_1059572 [Neurospora crassa]|nr:hypothetical protein GE21DRAFT_1059572 [Neurospora crassa]